MTTEKRYPTVGTNPVPYYVKHKDRPEVAQTDRGYFYIQVYGAQAAFTGPLWIGTRNLAIMSQVNHVLG